MEKKGSLFCIHHNSNSNPNTKIFLGEYLEIRHISSLCRRTEKVSSQKAGNRSQVSLDLDIKNHCHLGICARITSWNTGYCRESIESPKAEQGTPSSKYAEWGKEAEERTWSLKVMFTKEKNILLYCATTEWLKLLLVKNLKSLVSLMERDFCEQEDSRQQSAAVEQRGEWKMNERKIMLLRECLSVISQWWKLTSEERVGDIREVWLLFVKTSFWCNGLVAEYSVTLWTPKLHQLNEINLGSGDRASS